MDGLDGSASYINHDGLRVIGKYFWLDEQQIALIVEIDEKTALWPAEQLTLKIAITGILLYIILVVLVFLMAKQITAPLRALGETVSRISAGELDASAPILLDDEVGALARAYVRNDLDFTGSARRVIEVAEGMVGEITHGKDALASRMRLWHHQRRSNRTNIGHHYDVSNAFYALWLDTNLVYSCAYFRAADDTLDTGQTQKLDHICRKLRVAPGESFLDIGCGWGALLFHAAERYGVEATGITLSKNQYEHVSAEIKARGLERRVRVELRDYLDLPEDTLFDKIASVGMFEHVGRKNLPAYFAKIARLLAPGGLVLNHGITLNAPGRRELGSGIGEFVDDYVFPGGELAHISQVIAEMSGQGLEPADVESLRPHYVKTLWAWVDRLEAGREAAVAAVGERGYRIWRIYMAGSAHAFERGWTTIYQVLAGKPAANGALMLAATRDDLYTA
jgi:cyclopropane-fatty-acyl-phospholipid synthase